MWRNVKNLVLRAEMTFKEEAGLKMSKNGLRDLAFFIVSVVLLTISIYFLMGMLFAGETG